MVTPVTEAVPWFVPVSKDQLLFTSESFQAQANELVGLLPPPPPVAITTLIVPVVLS